MLKKTSLRTVKALWAAEICARGRLLDRQHDKEGHDWHSLWTGFVVGLGRPDLTAWTKYMQHGFPLESEAANAL